MAKDAKPEAGNAETPPPKKSKKLLIIIAAALILVLGIGGAAAFFLMKNHSAQDGEDGETTSESAKADKKKGAKEAAPVYVAFDAFTVNLIPETGEQFLQLVISVEVADLHVGDKLKMYTPKVRNDVMILLSGKKASELITKEGKEVLAKQVRDLINEIIEPDSKENAAPIKEVLFTSFIIQ